MQASLETTQTQLTDQFRFGVSHNFLQQLRNLEINVEFTKPHLYKICTRFLQTYGTHIFSMGLEQTIAGEMGAIHDAYLRSVTITLTESVIKDIADGYIPQVTPVYMMPQRKGKKSKGKRAGQRKGQRKTRN